MHSARILSASGLQHIPVFIYIYIYIYIMYTYQSSCSMVFTHVQSYCKIARRFSNVHWLRNLTSLSVDLATASNTRYDLNAIRVIGRFVITTGMMGVMSCRLG